MRRAPGESVEARGAARTPRPSPPVDTVTLRMRERLKERKRIERTRTWLAGARVAALGVAAIAAVWAVLASPLFSLQADRIEVSGYAAEISQAEVEAILNAHVGESLALLNVPHVEEQLGDLAGVREATVERVWPKGLRVTLVARQPVAAIPVEVGFVLVDADAVEVGTADVAPAGLPVMTVPRGDQRVLDAVLEVMRNLPSDVLSRVTSIGAQTEDSVSFTLSDGPRVDWGSAEDSALKAQVLATMLSSGAANGVAVVDVSAPTLPITRAQP